MNKSRGLAACREEVTPLCEKGTLSTPYIKKNQFLILIWNQCLTLKKDLLLAALGMCVSVSALR